MLVTEPNPRLTDIVKAAVDGGVDIVHWRDKSTVGVDRAELACRLRGIVHSPSLFFVNGDPEIAKLVGADGLHLPENGMPVGQARLIAGEGIMIGRSIHSVDAARRAEREGADYIVAGTIFASKSHANRPGAGLEFLTEVCQAVSIPVVAIGGVTPENAGGCLRAGASGVAVLSPIMNAGDPDDAARMYRTALDAVACLRGTAQLSTISLIPVPSPSSLILRWEKGVQWSSAAEDL